MKIIGHRGARGLAPENTIEGIQVGIDNGADMIEFDVRVAPNGTPVLHHDPLPADTDHLPTLQAVLQRFSGQLPLYVEVKPKEPTEPIIAALRGNATETDFYIASKSQSTLLALHDAFPNTKAIVIDFNFIRAARRAREISTTYVAVNQKSLRFPGALRWLARQGLTVYPYTINKPSQAKRWEKLGIAGVVTDFPDRFR